MTGLEDFLVNLQCGLYGISCHCHLFSCLMLLGLWNTQGRPTCVPEASGVTGQDDFPVNLQFRHSGASCQGLKSVVACSLALGMLMGDLFDSLEHPV